MQSNQPLLFDRVILNTFIGIAHSHIASLFDCFNGFLVFRNTPEELYLAMAAVGGLYCRQEGSTKIAMWYYNNARLKLLAKVRPMHISLLLSFILLSHLLMHALLTLFLFPLLFVDYIVERATLDSNL